MEKKKNPKKHSFLVKTKKEKKKIKNRYIGYYEKFKNL